jgi:hypothetical protein
MNNARLVMIAGLTVIVGMYSLDLQRPGAALGSAAVSEGVRIQAKQIARAGVGLAMTRMTELGLKATSVEGLPLMGGALSYTISVNADSSSASIVSLGSYQGLVVQMNGWIDETPTGRWVLRREYWQDVEI